MQFESFFERATGVAPFPYQIAFAQAVALPDLLRAPTGAGKTATAILGWLWRRRYGPPGLRQQTPRRLVFCLPMRTLVEQTEAVANHWLAALGLTETTGVFTLMGGAVSDAWDQHPERDAILIGTQDQLLSRALNRGYALSRYRWPMHFALLNNDCLWVLDEVQLMGVGLSTSAQLDALRRQWQTYGPAASLWMSATLDEALLRTVDVGDRGFEAIGLSKSDHAHPVLARRLNARKPLNRADTVIARDAAPVWKALAAEVVAAHQPGTLTLVVLNQVAHARGLYAALPAGARLLHSRFRPAERRALQAEVLAPGFDGILVSTQTIEAGVDLDARVLFTAVAPWDSLVQRFGRCNRQGAREDAQIYWVDLDDKLAPPYDPEALAASRAHLAALDDGGLDRLAQIARPPAAPALPVVRARDVRDLFDTTPDLTGFDLDVGVYIRDSDDADVAVAWRELDGVPSPDAPALHRDELCRVPVWQLRDLLKGDAAKGYRWDRVSRRWQEVDTNRPPVGDSIVLPISVGGYDPSLGWTGDKKHRPAPVAPARPIENDADERDPRSQLGHFVTLDLHARDVAEAMAALQVTLPLPLPWATLVEAGRLHDWGKAHPAFQAMMVDDEVTADVREGGPWAKSDHHRGKLGRPSFRHELASALAALQSGADFLTAYLIACHHGKVRTVIRARPTERGPGDGRAFALGVFDGDPLPATSLAGQAAPAVHLDLAPMALGAESWTRRSLALLDEHGPFRLAFLETLVRVADWRGSAKRAGEAPIDE